MSLGPQHIERRMLGPTPVLVVTDRRYPMVHFTVQLRQGAVVDAPGHSGTLNLMMELLLRGTKARSRRVFHTALETLGSSLDVGVGQEQAFVAGTALTRHLHETIDLLTEACLSPAFLPEQLQQLLEETEQSLLREREDDDALADYFLRQALYDDHPLGREPEGSVRDLRGMTLAHIEAAYACLSAADLIIGVAGDISADAAADLFAPLVAGLDRPAPRTIVPAPVPHPQGLKVYLVDKPDRSQVQLRLARLALSAHHPDVDAFWLGIMAFGGTFTSPLTREVRDERGWSYFAQADFRRRAAFAAPVILRSAPSLQDAVPCLQLEVALYAQLAQGGLAHDDLSRARDYVLNRYVFDIATAYDVVDPAMALERLSLPAGQLWDFPERLMQLDLTAVPACVSQHLHPHPQNCVVTLVGPAAHLLTPLQRALPQAQISVVDFREGLELNLRT